MKRTIFPIIIALFAAVSSSSATAQDSGEDIVSSDIPIIVTGTGLPPTSATGAYDVRELDREDMIATGSGRIEDALSKVSGFQQFRRSDSRSSNPSAQGVTLRALGGNATSRALVLLDGVPMADPFFGYARMPLGSGLSLILRGENLSNEDIVTRNQGGSIDLGTPRTVWAGIGFRM